ncbi:unnamed protein product [Discosporangium mesarthrocarpum]
MAMVKLWPFYCHEHTAGPYRRISTSNDAIACTRRDGVPQVVRPFPGVVELLHSMNQQGSIRLAVASRSPEESPAGRELLRTLGLLEIFCSLQIYRGSKTVHFEVLLIHFPVVFTLPTHGRILEVVQPPPQTRNKACLTPSNTSFLYFLKLSSTLPHSSLTKHVLCPPPMRGVWMLLEKVEASIDPATPPPPHPRDCVHSRGWRAARAKICLVSHQAYASVNLNMSHNYQAQ